MKHGKTIVVQIGEPYKVGKRKYAVYRCECGTEKAMRVDQVNSRNSLSCGCLQRAFARSGAAHLGHGMAKTRLWTIWSDMKRRTLHKHRPDYHRYGGRGIKFEERWKSFENFRDDMYEAYLGHAKEHGEKYTTLDRIDVHGDYEKSNCRWATQQVQGNNTRANVFYEHNGRVQTQEQWSRELGMSNTAVGNRIKRGLPLDAKYIKGVWTTK